MKRPAFRMAAAILALSLAESFPAIAAGRDGKAIVDEVCAACHRTGLEGAPRIGDRKAWKARAERGLSSLTQSAMEGVRKMPPHGGKLALNDRDLSRAITYMVNQSGGHWIEPIDRAHPPRARSGAEIVVAQCSKCHEAGINGAPRVGDRAAWLGRAQNGFDGLVRSAINGHGAMPARGGMADLTDAEMNAAVMFMFQTSVSGRAPEGRSVREVVAHIGEDIVNLRCVRCHDAPNTGAPRIGNASAWKASLKGGIAAAAQSAPRHHADMPSRGGFGGLTEDDVRAAIAYMSTSR
jgi:cytochrome c5